MGLFDTLQQALSGGDVHDAFDQVAQNASTEQLGRGLTEAMRSDETPPFGEMVAKMFGQSSSTQQAGLLNELLAKVGPALLSGAAGGALGRVLRPGATQVTPDQAAQISPDEVRQIAAHAEQAHPGVVEQVGQFYAQHSGLIKALGGAALAVTLAKMREHAGGG